MEESKNLQAQLRLLQGLEKKSVFVKDEWKTTYVVPFSMARQALRSFQGVELKGNPMVTLGVFPSGDPFCELVFMTTTGITIKASLSKRFRWAFSSTGVTCYESGEEVPGNRYLPGMTLDLNTLEVGSEMKVGSDPHMFFQGEPLK